MSATVLFLELALIRWIPAYVVYVGFFSNFVLIASFLGIGAGILAGRGRVRTDARAIGLSLLALVTVVVLLRFTAGPISADELFYGPEPVRGPGPTFFVLIPILALVAAAMGAAALPLGALLRSMPPLRAYALDIAGSLAGVGAFAVASALELPPIAWFSVVAALVGLQVAVGGPAPGWRIGLVCLAGVVAIAVAGQQRGETWSPYYRLTETAAEGAREISVNGIPHQALYPAERTAHSFYDLPYEAFPGRTFQRVLVIGAGAGTDVARALARGAEHVDAVEIDPAIQRIGRREHPDRPYDDARVRAIVDDGRGVLRRSEDRYDLIVFAQTDSLTLVTGTAAIRLESFLFTNEAFADARERLTPDGVLVLYWYRLPWVVDRYAAMLTANVGPTVVCAYEPTGGRYFILFATRPGGPAVAPPRCRTDPPAREAPAATTDDRPFPFLMEPGIPVRSLVALAVLGAAAAAAVLGVGRATGARLGGLSPHFFALGAAFLLLETRSIVTFGLLFGATWSVNALVFAAILLSILAAIAVNALVRFRHPAPLFVGLFLALALSFLIPPASLLFDPPVLRYAVASVLAFAPVFFANLVFARSFGASDAADMAFASNLLGAVAGGIAEWLALVTGYQALLLVVGALYAAAYLFATRWRLLADRRLPVAP